MSTHTPGLWEVCRTELDGTDDVGLEVQGETTVCLLYEHQGTSLRCFKRDHANARLIAAAPDLLAALKLCLPFCKGHQETPEKVARFEAARAAIAKAEGGS